jgi:hypothetical protein
MLFSQREGIKPAKSVIQMNDMDIDLHNCLWNAVTLCYWDNMGENYSYSGSMQTFVKELWVYHFKIPLDTLLDAWPQIHKAIKKQYDDYKWYEVYDFLEYVVKNYFSKSKNKKFMELCNSFLERELSAYRFVGGKITQITSQEEISEIEEALNISRPFKAVTIHIKTALALFSDKKSPDYRNSIKESISAVEAICKLIVKKENPDLGQALKIMENEIGLHPALKKAFNNLYGYTSDDKGIRHALLEEAELYPEDAKFMLISCSAFVNYLVSKISKTEIKI